MTGIEMDRDDDQLEDVFAAARRAAAVPSEALLARIIADAEDAMPVRTASRDPARVAPARAGLLRWLGAQAGWGALGGLATATVAGLWFGYAGLGETGPLAGLVGAGASVGATELLPGGDTIPLLPGWEG